VRDDRHGGGIGAGGIVSKQRNHLDLDLGEGGNILGDGLSAPRALYAPEGRNRNVKVREERDERRAVAEQLCEGG
jgi:hypothetical protein